MATAARGAKAKGSVAPSAAAQLAARVGERFKFKGDRARAQGQG